MTAGAEWCGEWDPVHVSLTAPESIVLRSLVCAHTLHRGAVTAAEVKGDILAATGQQWELPTVRQDLHRLCGVGFAVYSIRPDGLECWRPTEHGNRVASERDLPG